MTKPREFFINKGSVTVNGTVNIHLAIEAGEHDKATEVFLVREVTAQDEVRDEKIKLMLTLVETSLYPDDGEMDIEQVRRFVSELKLLCNPVTVTDAKWNRNESLDCKRCGKIKNFGYNGAPITFDGDYSMIPLGTEPKE